MNKEGVRQKKSVLTCKKEITVEEVEEWCPSDSVTYKEEDAEYTRDVCKVCCLQAEEGKKIRVIGP